MALMPLGDNETLNNDLLEKPSKSILLPELQNIFYKQELQAFLQRFVVSEEQRRNGNYPDTAPSSDLEVLHDLEALFKEHGFLTPDIIQEKLTEKYFGSHLDRDLQDVLHDVDLSTYTPDSMTEFLQKPQLGITSSLGHLYAKTTNLPVTTIEADYSNMGGTNDFHQLKILEESTNPHAPQLIELIKHKAHTPQRFEAFFSKQDRDSLKAIELFKQTQQQAFQLTDETAKLIALTIEKEISDTLPPGGKILPIRAGGDELRLIVVGLPPEDYAKIGLQIHNKIEEEMARLDLHDHIHLKRPSDPLSNGFGAALSMFDMREMDPASAIKTADNEIKSQKTILGRFRVGEIDEETARQEFSQWFSNPENHPQNNSKSVKALVEEAIDKARNFASEREQYFNKLKVQAPRTIAERRVYLEEENSVLIQQRILPIESTTPDYLKNITEKGVPFSPPAARREQAILAELGRRGVRLDDYQRSLIHAYAWRTTPTDPSSGAWMPNDMPATVEIYANDAKKLKLSPPYTIGAAFHNLGGLNEILGHDGANVALKEMHENIIVKALEREGFKAGDYQIAHYGGAEFNIVLKPQINTKEGIKIIDASTVERIEAQILANTKSFSQTNILQHLQENNIQLSPKDVTTLNEANIRTYEDVKDIKTERNISGVDVVTVSSKVCLNNKTAGFYIQQQRDKLDERVSKFRNHHAQESTVNELNTLYEKTPNIELLENHLGSISEEFKTLVQLKGMISSLEERITSQPEDGDSFASLRATQNRYKNDFNNQATQSGPQEMLAQITKFKEHIEEQGSPLTNKH